MQLRKDMLTVSMNLLLLVLMVNIQQNDIHLNNGWTALMIVAQNGHVDFLQ